MTRRDLVWRAIGVASLGAAGGLKALYDALASGSIEPSEGIGSVLGLACFLIACFGAVLLIEGGRIRDRWLDALRNEESEASQRQDAMRTVAIEPVSGRPDSGLS